MPELPEVETVRKGLQELLAEKPVVKDVVFRRRDLRDPFPVAKIKRMIGQPIESIDRRGKYLLLHTPVGFLLSHLGMTGSWRAGGTGKADTHDHFELHFKNGLRLVYRDPRRFGILDWGDDPLKHPRLKNLGPEPLSSQFDVEALMKSALRRAAPIKNVIMDASVVVGVGNIYASEALFRAKIKPARQARRLKKSEFEALVFAIREVLEEAIASGGSSISDYVQATGETGLFQERFRVYDRTAQGCVICETPIRRLVLGGRSTFFCPKCQR